MAGSTGFEPATSGLTVQCANQAAPRARRGTSRGYTAAFDNATTPCGWMRRGLRLGRHGHVVAGFSPPAAAAVDDRLRLLRADDLDLATGLPDHLPKRLSHVPIPRGDGPGFRARADARRARCSRRSRGSLTGPRQAV